MINKTVIYNSELMQASARTVGCG